MYRMTLFLSTSELEGLPLNILEAKLYGNYVCAVDCDTGPRELINPSLDYDSVIMQPPYVRCRSYF